MINLDSITIESNKEYNEKRPYIPDHPYRIMIIGGSGSGKTSALLKSIKEQDKQWCYWQNLFVCKRSKRTNVWIFDLKTWKCREKAL